MIPAHDCCMIRSGWLATSWRHHWSGLSRSRSCPVWRRAVPSFQSSPLGTVWEPELISRHLYLRCHWATFGALCSWSASWIRRHQSYQGSGGGYQTPSWLHHYRTCWFRLWAVELCRNCSICYRTSPLGPWCSAGTDSRPTSSCHSRIDHPLPCCLTIQSALRLESLRMFSCLWTLLFQLSGS